ncbi:MAG: hypothetical protein EXR86_05950 [Gammaproteobacteria bacterium]|nr:hypothetical protein [Gammaproteobacteria bacterium]
MQRVKGLMLTIVVSLVWANVAAEDTSDEAALNRPLPTLATPTPVPDDTTVFSTEASPPPAFDPSYQPATAAPVDRDP